MSSFIVTQEYDLYQLADHQTWQTLCQQQSRLGTSEISRDFLEGLRELNISNTNIAKIDEISARLEAISGWTLVPVTGLIPTRDFFYMLINKRYPVTVSIRRPNEVEFSEQPDIFHDICGHLPLLTNQKFTRFLTAFSIIGLKYVNNERAIDLLGRLYWFTYEMGIIREDDEYKAYGGAIITSAKERAHMQLDQVSKHAFSLVQIFNTAYNPYKLQNEYFVIDSFDDLFGVIDDLEAQLIEHLLLPEPDTTLRNYSLNANIGVQFNNVIGFLNDVQFKFPNAISFVAGQPDEDFFEIEDHLAEFNTYVDYAMRKTGDSRKNAVNCIGQYSKTKGIINDLLAEYLQKDENISVKEKDILVTVGAQEAFAIAVATVCNRENDVILVENPGYIGVSAFAKVFDYNIAGVETDQEGINLQALKSALIQTDRIGKKVKLLYVIPDYQNPSGSCMPVGNRLKLLELARQYNFLILEDSVYNSFTYAQKKNPTLKSLDRYNRVIYVGSFSKSLFPGLRVGLIAADQTIENEKGQAVPLIDEMVKVKAQLTNNTPTISQAILGGVLLRHNCSLSEWSKPKYDSYKRKRDHMLSALSRHIGAHADAWAKGIGWNEPDGGFFIKMTLPFHVDNAAVYQSASEYGVIFCPMRYFYLHSGGENELRLTFSNVSPDRIEAGVKRLSLYLKSVLTTELMEAEEEAVATYE